MKVILEFNLPEEEDIYKTAMHASIYRGALQALDHKLRSVVKYDAPLGEDDVRAACETLRALIREELDGVEL